MHLPDALVAMTVTPLTRRTLTPELEQAILAALGANKTYDEISTDLEVSRGMIYNVAVRNGARKNEARIKERASERKARQREFLTTVLNATEKADVLDFLGGLPDGSVALHLTSPPYNLSKKYGTSASSDSFAFSYWLGWQLQVLSEAARTLADGGVLFYQVGSTRGPDGGLMPIDIVMFQYLQQMGLTFQSRIAWVVPHGLTPKRRLAERYETALVFTKGREPRVFNPTPARTPQKQPGKRAFKGPNAGQISSHPFGSFPTNVWTIPNAGHNARGRVDGHPAQMPVALATRAIQLYTMPGDLVCDVFAGSGTTAEAALRTGRAFTGCDLFYEDVRRERLAKVAPDLVSHLPGVTDETFAVWEAEAKPVHVPAQPVEQPALFDSPRRAA